MIGDRHRPVLTWACQVLSALAIAALVVGCGSSSTNVPGYKQTKLVANKPGVAPVTDDHLVNSWGIAHSPTSPWWVANNHTGTSTVYDGNGMPFPTPAPLVVTIPPPNGSPPGAMGAPTGMVFNPTSDFVIEDGISANAPAAFIFAGEDGVISAWRQLLAQPLTALIEADDPNAIYKGLAISAAGGVSRLYATNFHEGTVHVFDGNFQRIDDSTTFQDPDIPAGFAPFGIQNINGNIFVTYAKQDDNKEDDVAGPGNGFVDMYDNTGSFEKRFVSQGHLNSPWGVVLAPASFGRLGGFIIIGNFGDGLLNAYDPASGAFKGALNLRNGSALQVPKVWGLMFGNDGNAGSSNTLFFSAGPNDENDGLFGMIEASGG
jgi:uncharacterized protein (TIGR03118 family)